MNWSQGEKLPWLFIPTVFVFATCYALLLPPLQVPDEAGHFYRAYELSEGRCIVPIPSTVPASARRIRLLYDDQLQTKRRFSASELAMVRQYELKPLDTAILGYFGAQNYTCLPYAAAAAAMVIGRPLGASAVSMIYIGRMANVLVYTGFAGLALFLLPGLRLVFVALALMPETLQQVSSLSADSLTNGITFLFIAYTLHLAFGSVTRIGAAHIAVMFLLVATMTLCKFSLLLVMLVFMIPSSKIGSVKRWIALISATLLVSAASGSIAQIANRSALQKAPIVKPYLYSNLQFVYQHPGAMFLSFCRTTTTLGYDYFQQFVGRLGWQTINVPRWAVWTSAALLLIASASGVSFRLRGRDRILTSAIFAASVFGIFVLEWGAEADPSISSAVLAGRGYLPGIQGRYFIPIALLFFFTISTGWLRRVQRWIQPAMLILVPAIAVSGLFTIWNAFYANHLPVLGRADIASYLNPDPTPASFYEGHLVQRIGPTPEDARVYLIRNGRKALIVDYSWIPAHGYRWPDDVVPISGSKLSEFPPALSLLPGWTDDSPLR